MKTEFIILVLKLLGGIILIFGLGLLMGRMLKLPKQLRKTNDDF